MFVQKRRIVADEELDEVTVAPEASELLFEAEDVAELVAEVTGQPVDVTAEEDTVVFTIGEDEFTVQAEGDEEVLEATRKNIRGKRTVAASAKKPAMKSAKKPAVAASTKASAKRPIRKVPSGK